MSYSHTLCLQNVRCGAATAEQTQTVTQKSPTITHIPGNTYFSFLKVILYQTAYGLVNAILSLARPLNAALAHRCVRLALLFQEGGFREKKICAFRLLYPASSSILSVASFSICYCKVVVILRDIYI
jgi:hypothetical protein